jgi:hypothetical protein
MATIQKLIKAVLDFTKKTPEQLLAQGYAILKAMTGNVNFPNLPVDLAVFKTLLDTFSVAIGDANDGSRKAITQRNQIAAEIVQTLRVVAFYVELNSKGNMNIFLSSGLTPRSATRTPSQPLAATALTGVTQGISGQLLATIKRVRGAKNYQLRIGQIGAGGATPTSWTMETVPNAKTAAALNGLTPGTSYAIQVRAYGPLGYTEWSDSVVRMAT